MTRTLAPAVLLAAALSLCCSSPLPVQNPGMKASPHATLAGHSEVVWRVAFSPDGQHLASGSVDRTVRVWRVSDGGLAQTLTHPEGITSVAFGPDGRHLASASYDRSVRVWSLPQGEVVRTLKGHEGPVWSVAFSPDGQSLASSGEDKTVKLWRLERLTTP